MKRLPIEDFEKLYELIIGLDAEFIRLIIIGKISLKHEATAKLNEVILTLRPSMAARKQWKS